MLRWWSNHGLVYLSHTWGHLLTLLCPVLWDCHIMASLSQQQHHNSPWWRLLSSSLPTPGIEHISFLTELMSRHIVDVSGLHHVTDSCFPYLSMWLHTPSNPPDNFEILYWQARALQHEEGLDTFTWRPYIVAAACRLYSICRSAEYHKPWLPWIIIRDLDKK